MDFFRSTRLSNNMKIAHITLLHGYNFGGLLQAYATQKILKSFGYDVVTLDYHPSRRILLIRKLTLNFSDFHKKIRIWIDSYQFSNVKQFEEFRSKYFQFSASCYNSFQLSRECQTVDAVVVGSDQVWSSKWLRPPYFLDFALKSKCKRLALSACCGQASDDEEYLNYCKRSFAKFDAISVRNTFTADLVKKTIGLAAEVICDPTLATELPTEPVSGITGPYILVYIINRRFSLSLAENILHLCKLRLAIAAYSIPPSELKGVEILAVDRVISNISPFQWSYLVTNASHVITDSFHGTIFSIKNHRSLTVIDSGFKSASRLRNFLTDLELEHLLVSSAEDYDKSFALDIDWARVDKKIERMKSGYHQFVTKHLS